ncbi:MAG: serine hydrolase domain-containing protein [Candidatus Thorarchaeota archaeon]|jgi:CubicO group peptidase (beta-lactamase class C family)
MNGISRVKLVRLGLALLMLSVVVIPSLPYQQSEVYLVTDESNTIRHVTKSIPSQTEYHLNVSDVTTFFNDEIPEYMNDTNVAGILISVVKDGEVLHSSGYGYADVAQDIAATTDTLFGIASISKTFTATAVMTLVENGTLDLDEDINTYLDLFQIPTIEGSDPITLKHLLTHTAGFEESLDSIFYPTSSGMPTMETFLRYRMPAQVHPAGYIQSYSNLGASLAGYIVQEVSGISYEQYIEDYVLEPLGMNCTTAFQELPAPFDGMHSNGYSYVGDAFVPLPYYYCAVPPTGGLSSSADDMAKFMMMHLNEGMYLDNQFLDETTILEMQEEQFIGHPELSGIGYGLYSKPVNNETMVYHTGGMPTFTSIMGLFPDHELGIFISLNSISGDYYDILDMFMDRYFPEPEDSGQDPLPTNPEDLSDLEGFYLPTRREYVGISDSLIDIYGNMITQVTALPDGTLSISSDYLPDHDDIYERVSDLLFRGTSARSDLCIGFRTDSIGVFMFTGEAPVTAMEKLDSWYLEVSGPNTVQLQEGDSSHEIYWTVNAAWWQTDSYTIYCNGTSIDTDYWTNMRGITYDMSGYAGGTYNLTIVVEDILDSEVKDTIIVEITPDSLTLPIYGLVGMSVVFLILSLAIVVRARK